MKRLYTVPRARGKGVGRQLVLALIDRAKKAGYRRILLDTLPTLAAAHALYRDLGFVEVAPCYDNPIQGVTFMALDLSA